MGRFRLIIVSYLFCRSFIYHIFYYRIFVSYLFCRIFIYFIIVFLFSYLFCHIFIYNIFYYHIFIIFILVFILSYFYLSDVLLSYFIVLSFYFCLGFFLPFYVKPKVHLGPIVGPIADQIMANDHQALPQPHLLCTSSTSRPVHSSFQQTPSTASSPTQFARHPCTRTPFQQNQHHQLQVSTLYQCCNTPTQLAPMRPTIVAPYTPQSPFCTSARHGPSNIEPLQLCPGYLTYTSKSHLIPFRMVTSCPSFAARHPFQPVMAANMTLLPYITSFS